MIKVLLGKCWDLFIRILKHFMTKMSRGTNLKENETVLELIFLWGGGGKEIHQL